MKRTWLAILLMILIVPLVGELKFHPFDGEFSSFRVSFGAPAFLFFLLWIRNISFIFSGLLVGLAVLVFRMTLDWTTSMEAFTSSFLLHVPAFFYYVTYATIFHLAKANVLYHQPLRIGLLSIIAELIASIVELMLSLNYSSLAAILTFPIISKILLIAVIRSFFVLSCFFIINLRHAEFIAEQQREQNKHILLLISGLYEEAIQLTKSLKNAENITRDCYHLYNDLHNNKSSFNQESLAQSLLEIAGQVHEIKKDNQRIYASLTQLISDGKLHDYMSAAELVDIIVQSHQKYARSMDKNITFNVLVEEMLPPLHVYTVLSLVNNLVSNAVESIQDTGLIKISFYSINESIAFRVTDTGPGIPAKKRNLIFKPGYTTKFDSLGNPSTGMGLPYIKDLANNLQGSITIEEIPLTNETVFTIQLPLRSLIKEG
ncbi:sensor histidine kinase [Pelosinus sp. sgz500959]|uniref:sensor histidine kinase n=1 Tax=Pelosinus sp. sgz500959 TaxID=3242472 RepID=UPI0036726BBE